MLPTNEKYTCVAKEKEVRSIIDYDYFTYSQEFGISIKEIKEVKESELRTQLKQK